MVSTSFRLVSIAQLSIVSLAPINIELQDPNETRRLSGNCVEKKIVKQNKFTCKTFANISVIWCG